MGGKLELGRDAHAREAWEEAYRLLSATGGAAPLGARDLERLATAAYMLGREDEYLGLLERAHRAHLDAGGEAAAVRCAFWLGINLMRRGEAGRAGGWLGRARRLLEGCDRDAVEHGYMLLPRVFERAADGEWEAAAGLAGEAAEVGRSRDEPDLLALAAHEQGHLLIRGGKLAEGLALLDEAMVTTTSDRPSPIVAGIVYCGALLACQEAHEVGRAREWTAALTRWCERQQGLVSFTGRCLVHRSEVLQLQGSWREALEEAERAEARCLEGGNRAALGEALYRGAEIRRVLGDLEAAEHGYREASRHGREPQPGLALLRLAQGRHEDAEAAISRAIGEAAETAARAALLPAMVEIALAAGDTGRAREASQELDAIGAGAEGAAALDAIAAQARGAVLLAGGSPGEALAPLRRAEDSWRRLETPYELARTRERLSLACSALGDADTAALEMEAARAGFAELGAALDLARVEARGAEATHGSGELTARELEVLHHLAEGTTNREIAARLVISERTVDRHVSNIYAKLGVATRAAATAYAYVHELL